MGVNAKETAWPASDGVNKLHSRNIR